MAEAEVREERRRGPAGFEDAGRRHEPRKAGGPVLPAEGCSGATCWAVVSHAAGPLPTQAASASKGFNEHLGGQGGDSSTENWPIQAAALRPGRGNPRWAQDAPGARRVFVPLLSGASGTLVNILNVTPGCLQFTGKETEA